MIALLLVTGLAVYPSGNYLHQAHRKLYGPALALSENSSVGWQEWIDAVRGCTDCDAKLDVAVIGTTGADELNAGFMSLHGVNSVETYILTAREPAQVAGCMERGIGDADVVFFKGGGSQCDFARWIRGTLVQNAVERVYQRGGGVGASWPPLRYVITDGYFHDDDRFGRLAVFLARTFAQINHRVDGLGIDKGTTVVITRDGLAHVFGLGAAYVVIADHAAEVLRRGQPLTYRGLRVWKFPAGTTLNSRAGGRMALERSTSSKEN